MNYFVDEILSWPFFLALLALALVAPVAFGYWRKSQYAPIRRQFDEIVEQLARIEKDNGILAQTIAALKSSTEKRLESIESGFLQLNESLNDVKREAHDIEKHVDKLETKTEVATTKVDAIKYQVDVDVSELKRIEGQIKESVSRVDHNARQIEFLAHEVRDLEHEVSGVPARQ